ncbi:MAG: FHA domain-containing protein [Anaerolineae bacterium]
MASGTVICPVCSTENPDGELLCSNCGSLLLTAEEGKLTHSLTEQEASTMEAPPPAEEAAPRGTSTFRSGTRLVLHYGEGAAETHQVVVVEDEITLGRGDEHTSFLPDVNLSRMAAWERGVSRLHASIKRSGDNLYLIDLASTNGTFLNDTRVPPREPQLLHDGDVIRLGLFPISLNFTTEEA